MKLSGKNRTSGHTNDRNAGIRFPLPTEIISQPHAACRISFHRMDAAVRRAGACRNYGPCFGRELIDPFTSRYRLPGSLIGPKRRPITFVFVVFVGNRSLNDENERLKIAFGAVIEKLHKLFAVFIGEKGVMKINFGNSGNTAEQNLFKTRLRRRRDGDGVAVTTETGRDPEDVDLPDRLGS